MAVRRYKHIVQMDLLVVTSTCPKHTREIVHMRVSAKQYLTREITHCAVRDAMICYPFKVLQQVGNEIVFCAYAHACTCAWIEPEASGNSRETFHLCGVFCSRAVPTALSHPFDQLWNNFPIWSHLAIPIRNHLEPFGTGSR